MKPRSRHAFTLIEIIIVLAIVGILTALLLPVFSRVRQNGEKTVCASNLRQLASAMQIYLQDNGGAFPLASTSSTTNGVGTAINWSDHLESSVPVHPLLRCPAVPDSAFWSPKDTRYQLGRDVSSDASSGGKISQFLVRLQSQFAQPAETELFIEGNLEINGTLITGRRIATKKCGVQAIFNLHLDGANIAYLDGHVKWMSAEAQATREEACGW